MPHGPHLRYSQNPVQINYFFRHALRRVVHLHRRAGFAATWKEIKRDLQDGPAIAVDRLLAGKSRNQGVPDAFEATAAMLADSVRDVERLKAWWIYRRLFGPDPLTERLALMCHNGSKSSRRAQNVESLVRRTLV